MEWRIKREIFPLMLLALFILLSVYFYPRMPEEVPSHFNLYGVADKFLPKLNLMLMVFAINVGLYLLLTFIPLIDPFWKKIQRKYDIFLLFRDLALVFMLFFYLMTITSAKNGTLQTYVLGVGYGLLFILLGNYLPKLPRNWFFGLRSPWTLSSEIVWKKTHILGGWLFVLAGIMAIVLSLLKVNLLLVLILTLTPAVLFSGLFYPLFLYRRLQNEGKGKEPEL